MLKKYFWGILFCLFIVFSDVMPSRADTAVGGVISTDTTWTLAGSPYNVTSTVQVYGTSTTPVTLTIQPGVVVNFASNNGLQIGSGTSQGSLIAQGTTTDRIVFTRSAASGTWTGINFQDGTVDGTAVIENADIQYSTGVKVTSASPTIRNSTITNVTGNGLYLTSANPTIDTVTVGNNGSYGIYLSASSPTITGGSLSNTSTTGSGIYGSGSPVISNYNVSIVNSAGKYGLYFSTTTSALSVTNSTISNGLYLGSTGIIPTITGNTFTNLDNSPLHAGANIIAQLIANNTLTGFSSAGRVEVVGEQVSQNATWNQLVAPYVVVSGTVSVYNTTTPSTLTIAPGTEVKFASGAGLQVGNGTSQGSLIAQGTTTDRIVFTRSAASGTWTGINFQDGTVDGTAVIENTDIQYSTGVKVTSASPTIRNSTITNVTGNGLYLTSANPTIDTVTVGNNGSYGIYLSASSPTITGGSLTNTSATGYGIYGSGSPIISNYNVSVVNSAGKYGLYFSTTTSALSVTNSTIANGLYLATIGIIPTIAGNTFTNLDNSPLHAGANIIAPLIANNTLTGLSSAGKIEVAGELINRDTLWRKQIAPYVVSGNISIYKDTISPATLTIEPATTIKFGGSLVIGNSNGNLGALIAKGTATERIVLTRSGTTGTWSGLDYYNGTVDETSVVENTDIQYTAGIYMLNASPVFRNCTMTDMTGYLSFSYSNPVLENVTITNNDSYGIYLSFSSPIITGGSLTNSSITGYGIYGSGSPIISNYSVSIANSPGKYGLNLSTTTSALSVTNSTISNGLYISSTGITPTITGNTFTNGDNSPPHAGAGLINQLLSNNNFSGLTSAGKIEVVGELVKQNALWKKWAAPYVVSGTISVYNDTVTASTLTIEPGVVVRFNSGAALQVGSGTSKGVIIADGGLAPITFTSSQAVPAPGNWSGVTLSGGAATASILNNIVVEYGGAGGLYNDANLLLISSSPVIRNSIIRNSAGSGIYMSGATQIPQVRNSVITGNKWGIYATNSNPYVANSQIYGNTTAGVWNNSTSIDVDARDNWWGATSGPYHATTNPSGSGNSVSDKVLFNPWSGQSPTSSLLFGNVKVTPTAFNPDGDYLSFTANISANANWTISITDSSNNVVRSFTGTGITISQKWFGEDSQSEKVDDGSYTYKIEAVNPTTLETASPLQGTLTVLRQVPIAILEAPTDDQIFSGGTVVNVTGTASDAADFKNYTLAYGTGDNPTSWTQLKTATTQVQNALFYAWDLTNASGGVYTLRLTVTDNAGNSTVKAVRIRLLWIQTASSSEAYISPNMDGIKDATTISATASYPVDWSVTISNSVGTIVKTFTASGSSTFSQTWNGIDSSGTLVPDGAYTYTVNALDPVSLLPAPPKTGTINVDNTLPSVSITAPAAGGMVLNTVSITGTATDATLDNYKVEYGPATGAGPWTLLASSSTPVSSGTLAVWITNDLRNVLIRQNGDYQLRLSAVDKAGNSSVSSIQLTVDNLILSAISVSKNNLNTSTGESISISYTINRSGTVTLSIIPEKLGANGTPVYQTSVNCVAAGNYAFNWNGTDLSGRVVPDEAYIYILNASDGTRTDGYTPPVPLGSGSVTCTQSEYNPIKNIPMTITYVPTLPSRININISWGTQRYKVMDAVPTLAATGTYDWFGMDPSQTVLAKGALATCTIASLLPENFLITTGDTPKVTMLKTDPYQISLSYGQFTRIKYTVSRQSNVTIKVVSPSGVAAILQDNLLQAAGDYEMEWTLADLNDAFGKNFAVSEEGDYAVSIQATNPGTGSYSITKGNLKVKL
ncbi:MAG: hypothetical protein CXR31_00305 [Geobacter sp.]|nr:MAG: hypothetical protein CXR31_00305 [Geobacter sp.]